MIDRPGHALSSGRHLMMWLIMVIIMIGTLEGCAALMTWFVIVPRAGFLVFRADLEQIRRQSSAPYHIMDEELVWPADPTVLPRDRSGAKYNADFPEPGHACASAYGDSFVWGDDIPPADGWIEQLSRRLGCRVANYGVSGYGTDQAYLRFRRTAADEAPVVMLGIFPENIIRNVNHYRGFLGWSARHPAYLKGRFILSSADNLEWIPRPTLGTDEFLALHQTPVKYIPHEYLLPDSRDGPVVLRFPYLWTLARIVMMPRLQAWMRKRPVWSDYYAADHPSGGLALTIALGEAFGREAERRGKRAVIIILPSASSFRGRTEYGAFEYAPLVAALRRKGIDVIDGGAAFLAALGSRSSCDLFSDPAVCEGHYGRDGGVIVSNVVAAELRRRGLARE